MPRRVDIAVEVALLALLLAAMGWTLRGDFRGGVFVTAMLAFTATLFVLLLIQEASSGRDAPGRGSGAPASPAEPDGGDRLDWRTIGIVWRISVEFLLAIVVLGVYLGAPLAIFWIMKRHCGAGRTVSAWTAVGAGVGLSAAFTVVLSLQLWPGMLPEIVPGVLGGGILPPL